jgi:hypothetical protein
VAAWVTVCADLVFRDLYCHLGGCVDWVADSADVGCEGAVCEGVVVGVIAARISAASRANSERFL